MMIKYRVNAAKEILKGVFSGILPANELLFLLSHYTRENFFKSYSDEIHLKKSIDWLKSAQDCKNSGGISATFLMGTGWTQEYPETSGYIIGTFLSYFHLTGDHNYLDRCLQIADWEIEILGKNGEVFGSFGIPGQQKVARVFNAGQVLLGLCALYEETRTEKYIQAALAIGNYIVRVQESDGSWIKDTFCGPKTYQSRVVWGLLKLYKISNIEKFYTTAQKALDWIINCQNPNGWFRECGSFIPHPWPITHAIDYTLRGLLEIYEMEINFSGFDLLNRVELSCKNLIDSLHSNGYAIDIQGLIPGAFDENWKPDKFFSCLTGNAQFAYLFYRLFLLTKNEVYKKEADLIMDVLKKTQLVNREISGFTGGISGSMPFYGNYGRCSFLNWATKFFADALMMKMNLEKNFKVLA